MYMDNIQLFAKNKKGLETLVHANGGRNRTIKSRKNQKALKKGNLQVFGNIGSRHHQISRDERKN